MSLRLGEARRVEYHAEFRVDLTDGQPYTRRQFVDEYGGTREWDLAQPSPEPHLGMRLPPDLATAATEVTSVAATAALAYKLTAEASLHAATAAAASTNHAAEWNAVLPNVKMGAIGASEELPRPCAVCRVAKVLCDREQPCSRCRP